MLLQTKNRDLTSPVITAESGGNPLVGAPSRWQRQLVNVAHREPMVKAEETVKAPRTKFPVFR